jgi:hypothetical protein
MANVRTFFVNESQSIQIDALKSGVLKRYFKLPIGSMVAFQNTWGAPALTFIFEKKCPRPMALSLSKLFLLNLNHLASGQLFVDAFDLYFESHQISRSFHYFTSNISVFCHSLSLNGWNDAVPFDQTQVQSLAITILNEYKRHVDDVFFNSKYQ